MAKQLLCFRVGEQRMRSIILLSTGALFFTSMITQASCQDLIAEMRSMKEAQTSIQASLIANHDLFADTIKSYTGALAGTSAKSQKQILINLDKTAESFRSRGFQAQKTSAKFESATEDLIQRLSKCMKN